MDDATIDAVREGTLEPAALLRVARECTAEDAGREALYDGIRRNVASLLRSGANPDEIELLRGALARIAALAVGQAQSESIDPLQELSIRIDTLRDLSADAKTFNAFYSVDRLKDQPHFMRCLEILEGERGEFSRGALLRALRLKEANGTRVLKTLEAARLIKRERQGQGVMVRLTPEGRKALLSWRSPNLDPALAENVFLYVKEREIPGVARRRWGASR